MVSTEVNNFYVGSSAVDRVYSGSTLVWGLPSSYTRYKCVWSTSTSNPPCWRTLTTYDPSDSGVRICFEPISGSTRGNIVVWDSARSFWSSEKYAVGFEKTSDTNLYISKSSKHTVLYDLGSFDEGPYTLEVNYKNSGVVALYDVDGNLLASATYSPPAVTDPKQWYLGNSSGTATTSVYQQGIKFYYWEISSGTKTVAKYVPAHNGSNYVLYDLVHQCTPAIASSTYYNNGTAI